MLFDAEMGVACEQNEVVENEKERTPRLLVNETPQHHLKLAPVESAQRRVETVVQQGLLLVLLFSQRVEALEEGGELGDHVVVEATVCESMPTHPLERGQVIGDEGALADHHTTLLEVGERQEQRGENGLQRGREGGDEVIELVLSLTPHTHTATASSTRFSKSFISPYSFSTKVLARYSLHPRSRHTKHFCLTSGWCTPASRISMYPNAVSSACLTFAVGMRSRHALNAGAMEAHPASSNAHSTSVMKRQRNAYPPRGRRRERGVRLREREARCGVRGRSVAVCRWGNR